MSFSKWWNCTRCRGLCNFSFFFRNSLTLSKLIPNWNCMITPTNCVIIAEIIIHFDFWWSAMQIIMRFRLYLIVFHRITPLIVSLNKILYCDWFSVYLLWPDQCMITWVSIYRCQILQLLSCNWILVLGYLLKLMESASSPFLP